MSVLVGRLLLAAALLGTVGSALYAYLSSSRATAEAERNSVTSAHEPLTARVARQSGDARRTAHASAAAGLHKESRFEILSPRLTDLEVEGIQRLPVILDRLRPPAGTSFSGLLHSWHLFGDDLWVADFSGTQAPFRDLLLESSVAGQFLGEAPVVVRTRYVGNGDQPSPPSSSSRTEVQYVQPPASHWCTPLARQSLTPKELLT